MAQNQFTKSALAGLVIMAAGILVLVGWFFDIAGLKSVLPGFVSMKANTALGFVLSGMALFFLARSNSSGWAVRASRICAFLTLLLGAATLCQYLFTMDFGIDQLLFPEAQGTVGTLSPGRMAPVTAANFILAGGALLLMGLPAGVRTAQQLSLLTGLIGLLTFLGYLYGATALIGIGRFTQMALHTSLLFILLSFGTLLVRASEGLVQLATGRTIGGWLIRRMLPFALGVPLLLGWLRMTGERMGYYQSSLGVALMMICLIVLLTALIYWAAHALKRMDDGRRQAEASTLEGDKRYRSLFENMLNGLAYCRMLFENGRPMDFIYLEVNQAFEKLTGLKGVTGKKVSEVIPGIQKADPGLFEIYGRVSRTGEPEHFETYVEALKMWFSISVYCPQPEHFVAVFDVITARKSAEEELKRLNAELARKNMELEQMIYAASHDLRSPLVNVQGFSKELDRSLAELPFLLRQATLSPEVEAKVRALTENDIAESLKYINSSIAKMDALLMGLLKLSRTSRLEVQRETLDMNELVREAVVNLEFRIKQSGAQVQTGVLPPCNADKTQISQVFANLIDNAVKYLDPGRPGIIEISGIEENGKVVYCVKDNGIGISAEHQAKVFELFYRLNPHIASGEGVGLSIVRRIMERHNGSVRLESEPGKGSRFYITLQH